MSTPIETNTEQLQEVLQQVYNLPNRSGGGTTPDLVVVVDGSTINDFSTVDASLVSIKSGSVASAIQKIEGGQPANVLLDLTVRYGSYTYHELSYPESVGIIETDGYVTGLTVMFRARYAQVGIGNTYETLVVLYSDGGIGLEQITTA
jgi:hypothetical protein